MQDYRVYHRPSKSSPSCQCSHDGRASGLLVFCDEDYCHVDPVASLMAHRRKASGGPMAVIIGPEGGFHDEERAQMRGLPHCLPLSLGPRILRADTAAVAALALVQAVLGDWRKS